MFPKIIDTALYILSLENTFSALCRLLWVGSPIMSKRLEAVLQSSKIMYIFFSLPPVESCLASFPHRTYTFHHRVAATNNLDKPQTAATAATSSATVTLLLISKAADASIFMSFFCLVW